MSIEILQKQDLSELLDLQSRIIESVSNAAFFNWTPSQFLDELKVAETWLAKEKTTHKIQGFLVFRKQPEDFEIMVLGTCPTDQKKGVMTRLIRKLKNIAAQQGRAILLEVHEHNVPALRFYLKMGFEFMRSRKNYYKDGGAADLYVWKKPHSGE